jgi:predicted FMN-binding regulatory protein PaiB
MKNFNNISQIEAIIGFEVSREAYEAKRELSNNEHIDYDDFLKNLLEIANENNANEEDVELMATESFNNL